MVWACRPAIRRRAEARLYLEATAKANANAKTTAKQMRGSLHCAAHDETVSSFGRDDDFWVWVRRQATANATATADLPSG